MVWWSRTAALEDESSIFVPYFAKHCEILVDDLIIEPSLGATIELVGEESSEIARRDLVRYDGVGLVMSMLRLDRNVLELFALEIRKSRDQRFRWRWRGRGLGQQVLEVLFEVLKKFLRQL